MDRRRVLLLVVAALVLLLLLGGAVVVMATRGRRLTSSPAPSDGSRLQIYPSDLARVAEELLGRPVSVESYALARMIASEAGSGPVPEKQAIASVALNDARAHGWSLLYTLAGPTGLFGPQRGWRYATSRDPYEQDLQVAEAVLAGELGDNTGGATKFVHAGAFGVQEGTGSYDDLVARWGREGLVPDWVPGTRDDFRVFRRVA